MGTSYDGQVAAFHCRLQENARRAHSASVFDVVIVITNPFKRLVVQVFFAIKSELDACFDQLLGDGVPEFSC